MYLAVPSASSGALGVVAAVFDSARLQASKLRFYLMIARRIVAKASLVVQRGVSSSQAQTTFNAPQFHRLHANCSALRVRQRIGGSVDLANVTANLREAICDVLPAAQQVLIFLSQASGGSRFCCTLPLTEFDARTAAVASERVQVLLHEQFVAAPTQAQTGAVEDGDSDDEEEETRAEDTDPEGKLPEKSHARNVKRAARFVQVCISSKNAPNFLPERALADRDGRAIELKDAADDALWAETLRVVAPKLANGTKAVRAIAAAVPATCGAPTAVLVALSTISFEKGDAAVMEAIAAKVSTALETALHSERLSRNSLQKHLVQRNTIAWLASDANAMDLWLAMPTRVTSLAKTLAAAGPCMFHGARVSVWVTDEMHRGLSREAPVSAGAAAPGLRLLAESAQAGSGAIPVAELRDVPAVLGACSRLEVPLRVAPSRECWGTLQVVFPAPRKNVNSLDNPALELLADTIRRALSFAPWLAAQLEQGCTARLREKIVALSSRDLELMKRNICHVLQRSSSDSFQAPFAAADIKGLFMAKCLPLVLVSRAVLHADAVAVFGSEPPPSESAPPVVSLLDVVGEASVDPVQHDLVMHATNDGKTLLLRATDVVSEENLVLEEQDEDSSCSDWSESSDESQGERKRSSDTAQCAAPPKPRCFRTAVGDAMQRFDVTVESARKPSAAQISAASVFYGAQLIHTGKESDGDSSSSSSFGDSMDTERCGDVAMSEGLRTGVPLERPGAEESNVTHSIVCSLEHTVVSQQASVSTRNKRVDLVAGMAAYTRRCWAMQAGVTLHFMRTRAAPVPRDLGAPAMEQLGLQEARQQLAEAAWPGAPLADVALAPDASFTEADAALADGIAGLQSAILSNAARATQLALQVARDERVRSLLLESADSTRTPVERLAHVGNGLALLLRCDRVTVHRVVRSKWLLVPVYQSARVLQQARSDAPWDTLESTHLARNLLGMNGASRAAACARLNMVITHSVCQASEALVEHEESADGTKYPIWSEMCIPLFDSRRSQVVGVLQAVNKLPVELVPWAATLGQIVPARAVLEKEHTLGAEAFSIDDPANLTESGLVSVLMYLVKHCDLGNSNPKAAAAIRSGELGALESITKDSALSKAKLSFLLAQQRARARQSRSDARDHGVPGVPAQDEVGITSALSEYAEKEMDDITARLSGLGRDSAAAKPKRFDPKQLEHEPIVNPKKLIRRATRRFSQDEALRQKRERDQGLGRARENRDWALGVEDGELGLLADRGKSTTTKSLFDPWGEDGEEKEEANEASKEGDASEEAS